MKPEMEKRLQTILDARNKQNQAAAAAASERQNTEVKNLADFKTKKETVIKPAFQEIIDLFQKNGVTLHVTEMDGTTDKHGAEQPPQIKLDTSAMYNRTDMKPGFTLYYQKRNRVVSLHTATSSRGGPVGDVLLDNLTADWIHEEFVKYQSS